MKHTVTFEGTEEEMTNQAWEETLSYVGDMQKKLQQIKEKGATEGSEARSEKTAQLLGLFWGIGGYYPHRALKEFFMGTRKIPTRK